MEPPRARAEGELFAEGRIHLSTGAIHTVKPLVAFPKGRLTVVTGVSGSGKTTLILESLIPGLEAAIAGRKLPAHVLAVNPEGIRQVKLIDATPIGINVRSTVATYANVHDELRKTYARTPDAKKLGYKAGDFSYNTGKLRCPGCDGNRHDQPGRAVSARRGDPLPRLPWLPLRGGAGRDPLAKPRPERRTLPELMAMDVNTAVGPATDGNRPPAAADAGRPGAGAT